MPLPRRGVASVGLPGAHRCLLSGRDAGEEQEARTCRTGHPRTNQGEVSVANLHGFGSADSCGSRNSSVSIKLLIFT